MSSDGRRSRPFPSATSTVVWRRSVFYVDPLVGGQGIGGLLMEALVAAAEANGVWTLQASIFDENTASLRLHKRFGFRVVGRRKCIGKMTYGTMAGLWRDTVLLERRSRSVGS